jgi:hypothetical protein
MPGQKREKLLTEMEKDRLINRVNMKDKKARAANDIRVKKKLSAWLKNIPDILLILDKLPEDQIREELTDNDVFNLFKLTETAMYILKFSPIDGRIYDERWISTQPGGATDLDIWRSRHNYNHIGRMYDFLGHRNPIIDFDNLEPLEKHPEFRDKISTEERRGMDRIRSAIKIFSEQLPK